MQRRSFEQNSHAERPAYSVDVPATSAPNPELLEQLYRFQKAKRQRWWRQFGVVLLIVGVVVFAAWQGYGYYQHRQLVSQIPAGALSGLDFPVYVPGSDYQTDIQSYVKSNDVLSFKATAAGNEFMFSEQAQPADFELSHYTNGIGISEPREITTSHGKALLGKVLSRNVLIVSTQNTLITVTSSADMGSLESLAHNLSKI